MTQPLAVVFYERLMPGSQLVNRLQDLGYRVQHISDPKILAECVEREKPLLLLIDLESGNEDVCGIIAALKRNPATKHLPIISFAGDDKTGLQADALHAGATLAVGETVATSHLAQLLDQALQIE